MTDIDISSYSCKELCEYLYIYGTDREKKLAGMFAELTSEIEEVAGNWNDLDLRVDEQNCEICALEVEIVELEDTVTELKEKLKNGDR